MPKMYLLVVPINWISLIHPIGLALKTDMANAWYSGARIMLTLMRKSYFFY